ncbi:UNVERIFIED_CONTAM: hypothetical protein FKN15_046226 [Acipenser sinensis]
MEETLSVDRRSLTYGPDRGHIFGMPWLDSCLEETLLPEKPWHRVYNTLGAALAKEVEAQLKHPQQSQFIFTLLGEHFVEKHFSDFPNQPSILCPPSMSESERDSLGKNTLATLEELCEKAAQSSHCQRRPDEGIPLPGLQPPPLSSPGSEVLGRSVSAILASDPQRMATVCERLKGRPLPNTLRNSVWIDKLLNTDKVFHKAISLQNLEKAAREKFGRAVGHRVAELKLRSATRSPVSGLIENAVVEAWLKEFDPLDVKLTVSMFYGNVKLRSKSSLLKPSVEKRAPGKETDEFRLQFNDTFVFDSLDPSEFREVDPSEDKPVLVVKLLYGPAEPVQQGSGIRVTVYDPAKKLHRQRDSPVTGRIMRSGLEDLPDILALPELKTSARNPEFRYRMTVKADNQKPLDPHMMLLLRVYTIDADSGELCVIGNCIARVFNDHGQLNAGGFQLRLRGGMPSKDPVALRESSLDHHPVIPCCTVLIRILPHVSEPAPTPSYLSGFYFTDEAKPNKSELEIISTFQRDKNFPTTEEDMVQLLIRKEQANIPPDQWLAWFKERLDAKKQLPPQHPPAHLSIHHMVRYHQQAGIRVHIAQAFGLPGRGQQSRMIRLSVMAMTRRGGEECVLHPHIDPHSILLVQLFSLNAVYTPDPSGQRQGSVTSHSGGQPDPDALSPLGWAALPLFQGAYACTGVHHTPLFEGTPDAEFLGSVSSCPVKNALAEGLKRKSQKLLKNFVSLAVKVWDGHYFDEERHDLPVSTDARRLLQYHKADSN